MMYNDQYLATYKRYRDIMDTNIIIVVKPLPNETLDHIYQIKGIAKTVSFLDGEFEVYNGEIALFIDELNELVSDKGMYFPTKDILNRIKLIRFNGTTYYVESKVTNFFNNILIIKISSRT